MSNAAIYLRVSTDLQDYTRQKRELLAFAKAMGYDNPLVFEEKASAVEDMSTREQLSLMRKLTKDDVEKIFIWDVSRLSRNSKNFIDLIHEFTNKGICLHFKERNIVTLDRNGELDGMTKLFLYILGMFAEMDAENRKAMMKSGKKNALASGKSYTPQAPFGYYIRDKYLYIEEELEAPLVRDAFRLYKEGKSFRYIADYFNTIKFKPKEGGWRKLDKVWEVADIWRLVSNTVYYGEGRRYECTKAAVRDSNGRIIEPAQYVEQVYAAPAIVDKTLWLEVNDLRPKRPKDTDKTKAEDTILSGLLKCGYCGCSYYRKQDVGSIRITYADGTQNRKKTGCKNKPIETKIADSLVWKSVKSIYDQEQSRVKFEEEKISNLQKIEDNKNLINGLYKTLDVLERDMKRANNGYIKGILDDETYLDAKHDINKEVERMNKNISDITNENILLSNKLDASDNYDKYISTIDDSDYFQKKSICAELIDKVFIYLIEKPYQLLTIRYKMGLELNILMNIKEMIYLMFGNDVIRYNKDNRTFIIKTIPSGKAFSFETVDKEITVQDLIASMSEQVLPII